MGKIEDKKKRKKEALLVSAYQLFTEKGVDNTSISEIASRAKMAKGTFYLYFKDKTEVQNCLIARQANQVFEEAKTEVESWIGAGNCHSFEEGIIFLVNCVIDQLDENPSLLRFISKNLSWGLFSNIRFQETGNQSCMDLIDRMLERSKKKYREKELMVYMIVELVNATCHTVILEHAPVPVRDLKRELNITIQGILHQFEYA